MSCRLLNIRGLITGYYPRKDSIIERKSLLKHLRNKVENGEEVTLV